MARMSPRSIIAFDDDGEIVATIELVEKCFTCDGEGVRANFEARSFDDCQGCGGRGVALTEQGRALLGLVAEWAPIAVPAVTS